MRNKNYSQTPIIRPSLIQLFVNPAKKSLEQIFLYYIQWLLVNPAIYNPPKIVKGTNGGGLKRSALMYMYKST